MAEDSVSLQTALMSTKLGVDVAIELVRLLREMVNAKGSLTASKLFNKRIKEAFENNKGEAATLFKQENLEDATRASERLTKADVANKIIQNEGTKNYYIVVLSDDAENARNVLDEKPLVITDKEKEALKNDFQRYGKISYSFSNPDSAEKFECNCNRRRIRYDKNTIDGKATYTLVKTDATLAKLDAIFKKEKDDAEKSCGIKGVESSLCDKFDKVEKDRIVAEVLNNGSKCYYVVSAQDPSIAIHVTAEGIQKSVNDEPGEIASSKSVLRRGANTEEKATFAQFAETEIRKIVAPIVVEEAQYNLAKAQHQSSKEEANKAIKSISEAIGAGKSENSFVCVVSKSHPGHRVMFDGKTLVIFTSNSAPKEYKLSTAEERETARRASREALLSLGNTGDAQRIDRESYGKILESEKFLATEREALSNLLKDKKEVTLVSTTNPNARIVIDKSSFTVFNGTRPETIYSPQYASYLKNGSKTITPEIRNQIKIDTEIYNQVRSDRVDRFGTFSILSKDKTEAFANDVSEIMERKADGEKITLSETEELLTKHGCRVPPRTPFAEEKPIESETIRIRYYSDRNKYVKELFSKESPFNGLSAKEIEEIRKIENACNTIILAHKENPDALAKNLKAMEKEREERKLVEEKLSQENGPDQTNNSVYNKEQSVETYLQVEKGNILYEEVQNSIAEIKNLPVEKQQIALAYFAQYVDRIANPIGKDEDKDIEDRNNNGIDDREEPEEPEENEVGDDDK